MFSTAESRAASAAIAVAGLIILSALLFFPGIGAAPLLDRDESAYAEAPREMLAQHDWIVTRFNGQPWFDKPPLVYWAVMASYSLLGVNETAARLPVALFGVAGVLATYWVGIRLRDRRFGLLAGAVLATSIFYFGLARATLLDVPFTACFTLAMGALTAAVQQPDRIRWKLLAGAALGLAILAKSPSAVILFGGVLVAYGLLKRSPTRWRALGWLWAVVPLLAVAAPWYVAMYIRFGTTFLSEFLLAGNVGRFMAAEHTRSATPIYYVPVSVVGFLPWTPMLPGAIRSAWRRGHEAVIPLLWAGLSFLFFSASQSKLPGYILPAFPALALLIAFDLDDAIRWPPDGRKLRGLWWAGGFTLLLAAGFLAYSLARDMQFISAAALIGVFGLVPLIALRSSGGRARLGIASIAGIAVCVALVFGCWLLPAFAHDYSAKGIGLRIRSDAPRHVYLVGMRPLYLPSLLFYSRRSVTSWMEPGRIPPLEPGDAFVVTKDRIPAWFRARGLRHVASAGKVTLWTVPPARSMIQERRSTR